MAEQHKTEADQGAVDQVRVRLLPDRRVTRRDGGAILGRNPKTMANWAIKGWGPKPILVGGRVFHDYDECVAMARGEKPIKPIVNGKA